MMKATDTPDDTTLMLACRDGDMAAFRRLVERHQHRLVNFFQRMGVSNNSEDLVQETFLRIFRYRRRYRPRALWTTYMYTVARNVCYDYLRKQRRCLKALQILAAGQAVAEDVAMRQRSRPETAVDIETALNQLSPKLRMVVVLAFFEGQDYRTIARALRIPTGTVKSRMFLAVKRLRNILEN